VDTELDHHQILQSTAISAKFVNEVMSRSRSRRQVLLLDCCHSGAFREGMLAKGEETAGVTEQLQGQGRVVLTASNALQYSFEGDTVHGTGKRSIFTHALVEGLKTGDADCDGDGRFSINDLYSYVRERIKDQQQPMKIEMVEGELFLGDNPKPKATRLPEDLVQDLSHDRREIRLSAVERLHVLLQGSHKGRALAAQLELSRLQWEDDSQRVREAAKRYLDQYQAEAERRERERAEATERERKAREQAEAERQEREKAASAGREPAADEQRVKRYVVIGACAVFVTFIVVIAAVYWTLAPETSVPETAVTKTPTPETAVSQAATPQVESTPINSSTPAISSENAAAEADKYYYGQGVARDYAKALEWYRKAADQGYADGEDSLGYMYYHGLGVTQDYAEALKWCRKAADQGNAYGEAHVGDIYYFGNGVARDYAKALEWYRKAADQGYADARVALKRLSRHY
jgi:hypothetical protein